MTAKENLIQEKPKQTGKLIDISIKRIFLYSSIAIAVYFFGKTFSISLFPIISSLVFVAILNPIVLKLEKLKVPRIIGSVIAILLFLSLIIGIFGISLPFLYKKINSAILYLQNDIFLDKALLSINNFLAQFPFEIKITKQYLIEYLAVNINIIDLFTSNILHSGEKIVTIIFFIILSICLSFLILKDIHSINSTVLEMIPLKNKKDFKNLIKELNDTVFLYLNGQFIVAVFLFFFYSIGLYILGVENFLIISTIVAISTFIPYLGFYFSCLISFFLMTEDGGNFIYNFLKLTSVLCLGQLIEGNFITPKVMSKKIGINPVFFIIGTLFCIPIFGFLGIILGTPLTIIISVFAKRIIKNYKESSFYLN